MSPTADLSSPLLSVTKPLAMHSPMQMANLAISIMSAMADFVNHRKISRSGCCTTENHEVPASLGLFLPTDFVVFKVEADFFQLQTPYAQHAIEVASIISLVCHHEACLW